MRVSKKKDPELWAILKDQSIVGLSAAADLAMEIRNEVLEKELRLRLTLRNFLENCRLNKTNGKVLQLEKYEVKFYYRLRKNSGKLIVSEPDKHYCYDTKFRSNKFFYDFKDKDKYQNRLVDSILKSIEWIKKLQQY